MGYEKATRAVLKAAAKHSVKATSPEALRRGASESLSDLRKGYMALDDLARLAQAAGLHDTAAAWIRASREITDAMDKIKIGQQMLMRIGKD